MKPSVLDPCLFYKINDTGLQGIQATQVDDTLGGGDEEFSALEEQTCKRFECKPRTNNLPFQFNGFWVDQHETGGYVLHQKDYCSNIQETVLTNPQDNGILQQQFASYRGNIAYASTCTRPTELMDKTFLSVMNKTIRNMHDPAEILYLPLGLPSVYIAGYADAPFANNADLSSQLGYIVILKDKHDTAAIIHYGSWKCQRVADFTAFIVVQHYRHYSLTELQNYSAYTVSTLRSGACGRQASENIPLPSHITKSTRSISDQISSPYKPSIFPDPSVRRHQSS